MSSTIESRLAAVERRIRHGVAAFALAAMAIGPAVAEPSAIRAPSEASELMRRVAEAYASTSRGVIGVRSSSVLTIKAPVFRRRIARDGWFVFVDGTLARSSEQHDPRQPPIRDPYRLDALADYAFAYAPCPDCADGTVAVTYGSTLHDDRHASGRLLIQLDDASIVGETEKPYTLPWPTQDGQLVATWGRTDGGWLPIAINGAFVGRIGPFVGHAIYAQSLTSYARYANVDAAAAALTH